MTWYCGGAIVTGYGDAASMTELRTGLPLVRIEATTASVFKPRSPSIKGWTLTLQLSTLRAALQHDSSHTAQLSLYDVGSAWLTLVLADRCFAGSIGVGKLAAYDVAPELEGLLDGFEGFVEVQPGVELPSLALQFLHLADQHPYDAVTGAASLRLAAALGARKACRGR